jgi:xanthine dehydrogenase accessory factor
LKRSLHTSALSGKPERLAKLKAPAGLDFGAITPDEIAISILAEIVAAARQRFSWKPATPPLPPPVI